jgi:hypothetical protein
MRLLLLLILVLVFVVINPTARERAMPYAEPVLNPVNEWSTKSRLAEYTRLIREAETLGSGVRSNNDLAELLRREYPHRDATVDPWGTPYYIQPVRGGFTVASAGRDRVRGTEHDLHSDTIRVILR